jgi:hypothetical protein
MSDHDLDRLDALLRAATPGPWVSSIEGRDHTSGSSFIQTPRDDMYLSGATDADQDLIARMRDDLPRLLRG